MIAAVLRVRSPDALVVLSHAVTHATQRLLARMRQQVAPRYAEMRGMIPVVVRERAAFESPQYFVVAHVSGVSH